MHVFFKCLAADTAIGAAGVVILYLGAVVRRIYSVPQNPYVLLWIFVIVMTVGFALVAYAGIRSASSSAQITAIVAGSILVWIGAFYAVSLVWINLYGT
jgi:hypothetical protein